MKAQSTLFYCFDCGRRFFNKGWHAEACGSSNYAWLTRELAQKLAEPKTKETA